ncbi:MAG: hypothetical protein HC925_05305 [Coleofasciculaceae cyanobacterium SM2_3_26]|nr:hypothetical protein [Coleofasciculaceae cyanobacterium SM2_3_26]
MLGRYATSRTKSTPLRILSVPCSTGEEPYSIAIALLEAGLSPQQFAIDAVGHQPSGIDQGSAGDIFRKILPRRRHCPCPPAL